jgi:hypothetical protein
LAIKKRFMALLMVCALLLMPAQAAHASERYVAISPGATVEVDNGDGSSTHFVLDPLAAAQPAFQIDTQWWRMVYEAVQKEVKELAPATYHERSEDILLLLHNRPMDHRKIVSLRFRLVDGRIVTTGQLNEEQALRLAHHMFLPPEDTQEYSVYGWFYWGRNDAFDVMALDCRDDGETTIHELAHAFTAFDTTDAVRERIAEGVVKSLESDDEFMALLGESSLTPHLEAPSLVAFEDFPK